MLIPGWYTTDRDGRRGKHYITGANAAAIVGKPGKLLRKQDRM